MTAALIGIIALGFWTLGACEHLTRSRLARIAIAHEHNQKTRA